LVESSRIRTACAASLILGEAARVYLGTFSPDPVSSVSIRTTEPLLVFISYDAQLADREIRSSTK
jgi:hypothetical protein